MIETICKWHLKQIEFSFQIDMNFSHVHHQIQFIFMSSAATFHMQSEGNENTLYNFVVHMSYIMLNISNIHRLFLIC